MCKACSIIHYLLIPAVGVQLDLYEQPFFSSYEK